MRRSLSVPRIAGLPEPQRGLTSGEVEARRQLYGSNDILDTPPAGWLDTVRDTLRDPMVWFLLATAVLFAGLGDFVEAAVLALALLPIIAMDTWLHRRTQASTEGLSDRLAATATVLRDGSTIEIPAGELVPGDLALVREGQAFPADGLIVSGDGLQADESSLTGEAMPVRKQPFAVADLRGEEMAVDSQHWGAAGTRLLTGQAGLRIVLVGPETLYGQIVRSARSGVRGRTPLQQALGSLVAVLLVVAGILCVALAGIRYYQGHGAVDALVSAVTLAVAALPEEFPVVFTFFLGVGVYRLARRQALVRRALVVENIGRITCICTDKTGTLTEGRLLLAHCLPAEGVDERRLAGIAATAARPESGDPMDMALLQAAPPLFDDHLATFPFTEDRRREVAVMAGPDGPLAMVKGAPETVLAMTTLDDVQRAGWLGRTQELAAGGHKVIACAERRLSDWPGGEPDREYAFAGLLAFEDPLREGAAESVAQAQAGGIRVIMVTGDHPFTARAIAAELGLGDGSPEVVDGNELAARLQRGDSLAGIDVVARAIPAQKLDLVRALQQAGEIVAVTGDGVNDVPALQGADVGIAMGERGTRSAREVAAIVLLDDNFRTIVGAIAEGRQLFLNLQLSFAYLLMVHAPLVATAALVPLAGFPLLYLPAHVVWLELIIHPTALLVFQQLPVSTDLGPTRRSGHVRFFDLREWAVIAIVGAVITMVIIFGYDYSLGAASDVVHARAMAMVALVLASATVTAGLSGLRSRAALVSVTATVASAVVIVQFEPLAGLLHLSPLHVVDWLIAAGGGLLAGSLSIVIPLLQRRRLPFHG